MNTPLCLLWLHAAGNFVVAGVSLVVAIRDDAAFFLATAFCLLVGAWDVWALHVCYRKKHRP